MSSTEPSADTSPAGAPLCWDRPSGHWEWTAVTVHDGIDIHLTVTPDTMLASIQGGTPCPCPSGACQHPRMPWVTVHAIASVPLATAFTGIRYDLAVQQQTLHVANMMGEPGPEVNTVALALAIAAAAWGRETLAELAGHAARLGVTHDSRPPATAEIVNEQGETVRHAVTAPGKAVLRCVTPAAASAVATWAFTRGNDYHTAVQQGAQVVITYADKRYPLDAAQWAFANGYATDAEAANTIARL